MARVILLTGGNLGDVKSRLQCAQQQINEQIGPVLRCSHRYESRPWGFDAETLFSNQVLEADTDLSPDEVLDASDASRSPWAATAPPSRPSANARELVTPRARSTSMCSSTTTG